MANKENINASLSQLYDLYCQYYGDETKAKEKLSKIDLDKIPFEKKNINRQTINAKIIPFAFENLQLPFGDDHFLFNSFSLVITYEHAFWLRERCKTDDEPGKGAALLLNSEIIDFSEIPINYIVLY